MTDSFYKGMKNAALGLGMELGDDKIGMLYTYYSMLIEKNKVMNLTAVTEEAEVITKHFADSMSIVKAFERGQEALETAELIDIGTGAGFPGLVLKIVFPGMSVTLFDSLNKRLRFLDEVITAIKLSGVRTVHGRAEDFGRDRAYRDKYDIAVSRAVAGLPVLCEYCLPFVKTGGCFVAYKSAGATEELSAAGKAIMELGGGDIETTEFVLPESDISRSLIRIKKLKKTPAAYPRRAGIPSKEPIS